MIPSQAATRREEKTRNHLHPVSNISLVDSVYHSNAEQFITMRHFSHNHSITFFYRQIGLISTLFELDLHQGVAKCERYKN